MGIFFSVHAMPAWVYWGSLAHLAQLGTAPWPMLGAGRIAPAAPSVDRGTVSGPSRASTRDGQLDSSTHQLAGGEGGRFGAYMNCLMGFERSITNAFGELGFFVATYPREVQVACLVMVTAGRTPDQTSPVGSRTALVCTARASCTTLPSY